MYSNYNYYPQQSQNNQQNYLNYLKQQQVPQLINQIGLKGRLVASLEEARATSIDFDGSIFYFPDLANKKIYTKQINIDGTATLNVYELKELKEDIRSGQDSVNVQFVTREEFEKALISIKEFLSQLDSPSTAKKVEVLPF